MRNPKGDLIEYCRAQRVRSPKFETRNIGSDHEPLFMTDVMIDGEVKGSGQGSSKRDSERLASEEAFASLIEQYGPAQKEKRPATPTGRSGASSEMIQESWPIYADVLVKTLEIANYRVDSNRRGPESLDLIRKMTVDLYKGLLEELGATLDLPTSLTESTLPPSLVES